MPSPIAARLDKHQFLTQHYDALYPEGQAAIDAALVALPHRPVAARPTVPAVKRLPLRAGPSGPRSSSR
jgi:hypothetical protein